MKAFYYNEDKKLYKRIRWSRDFVYFLALLVFFFLFFFFLLSKQQELLRPLYTSLFLALIITIGVEISYLIDNKEYIYVVKKGTIYVIMFQNDSYFLDDEFLTSEKLRKDISEEKLEDILSNTDKYIGVSILKVEKVKGLKEKNNSFSFKSSGDLSFWKAEGTLFTVNNFVMDFRKKRKKLIVTKEYKDYDIFLKIVREKVNS